MTTYLCHFNYLGAIIVITIKHDDKSQQSLTNVCEALASRLGADYLFSEETL